ncbi:MAG: hypothetical protein IPL83_01025 [Bdellovibrionales bacterium]|nr:hypothetical protein [Bdellovibrionales bacterium]
METARTIRAKVTGDIWIYFRGGQRNSAPVISGGGISSKQQLPGIKIRSISTTFPGLF